MENHSYSQIIGSSAAPYINSLAAKGALATSYSGVTHPSLPNYLALTGGSTFGITTDCTTCWISAQNIADTLESAGSTWKAYEESMPSPCFIGDSYPYAQRHDPFIYFNDIRTNSSRCQSHVVPYGQLATDLKSAATTPNYAFITPNVCNDMHDCSVGTGDLWLQQQVPQILTSPAFTTQRSLLALTWDEDDSSGSNQVPLIFVGSGIGPAVTSSNAYDHYSLLHTVEVARGAATLTSNDAGAPVMSDLIGASQLPPTVVNSIAPQAGFANGGSSVTINGSGLSSASKVNFGSQPASSFTVVSDTQITAVSPPQPPGIVDVTVTAASTSVVSPADQFTVNPVFPGQYTALAPFRILDTRNGTGGFARLGPGQSIDVQVAGVAQSNVPAMSSATPPSAVVLNVTVTAPSAAGYLTVYPTGVATPLASTLNFAPGQTVANLAEVALGVGGKVTVFNSSGSSDVVLDVAGWISTANTMTGTAGLFQPLAPARLLDTRKATTLGPGQSLNLPVAGKGGVPATGASGAVLNVTATNASAASYLTVFPTGGAIPVASNLNFVAGQTVPNRVIAKLGSGGSVSIFNGAGSVDVVVDVGGWFTEATVSSGAKFAGVIPTRILDTRSSQHIGPAASLAVAVASHGGVPATGATAVVLNVTVTNPTAASFLTAWPDGTSMPLASDLNYVAGQTVPNLVVVKLGPNGWIDLYNASGTTDVVVDVVGWYG